MGDKSNIEWTDATWNPIVGCSIVSPGCTNCYAMGMARRIEAMSKSSIPGGNKQTHYAGTTKVVNGNPVWTGKLALAPEHILTAPLRWKKPRMIFVNSMGDLFHEDCPHDWIDQVFAVMALAPQHTFQVLTKRAERMRNYLASADHRVWMVMPKIDQLALGCARPQWPLPNLWLGVSTEDQKRADERIPHLLATPAAVRFVSCEPLLGPIDLTNIKPPESLIGDDAHGWSAIWKNNAIGRAWLNWVIVGGESGPNARPMHPDWARSLRDQCEAARVPFFFKQHGEWIGEDDAYSLNLPCIANGPPHNGMYRVGKHRAGRLLDGREHNGMPGAFCDHAIDRTNQVVPKGHDPRVRSQPAGPTSGCRKAKRHMPGRQLF